MIGQQYIFGKRYSMRAIFKKDIQFVDGIANLEKKQVHHLVNVVRIKLNDPLLILDGKGTKYFTVIKKLAKRDIQVKLVSEEHCKDDRFIDLLLAPPKKEAFFEILKNAVELNIKNIYTVDTQYSQRINIAEEKIKKILCGAYEQSNYCYEATVFPPCKFKELDNLLEKYNEIYYFTTARSKPPSRSPVSIGPVLIIIGPEGGFTAEEDQYFANHAKVYSIQFKTNIMRSQTAVTAAVGFLQN
jgi:16S rRNA (uracil1498-N3)-methyltransferase